MKSPVFIYFGLLCLALILVNVGCSDTMGCTDHNAENWNPDANVDDGSCSYLNKFLGQYRGSLLCGEILGESINNDKLSFLIREAATGKINDVIIKLFFPLTASATVTGNNIVVNSISTIMDFIDIDKDGIPEHIDLQISGIGSISGDTITINLTFIASNPFFPDSLTDQCILTGIKI